MNCGLVLRREVGPELLFGYSRWVREMSFSGFTLERCGCRTEDAPDYVSLVVLVIM